MTQSQRAHGCRLLLSLVLLLAIPKAARAEAYVSPFLGVNFGGDSGCPEISSCEDRNYSYGVALGARNVLLGFEEEFSYSKNFFGDDPLQSTSVLTLMSNLVIGPRLGIFRPYGLIGIGLVKTHVDLSLSGLTSSDNDLGWNTGGGLEISGGHFGVRGDVRYFHGFQAVDLPFVAVRPLKLDYGRASGALVFRF